MIEHIKALNPNLIIKTIDDPAFTKYGKRLKNNAFQSYFYYLESHTAMPQSNNQYVPHDETLKHHLKNINVYVEYLNDSNLQFGYVNGYNSKLNALEYHHSNEINLAATPLVLFLGLKENLKDFTYDVKDLEVFYIEAYTAIEIYDTTLHFSPCKVDDNGFKCGVVLPYGTNMEFIHLEQIENHEDHILFKTNKWLIAHPENEQMIRLGAHPGIIGPNLEIKYK